MTEPVNSCNPFVPVFKAKDNNISSTIFCKDDVPIDPSNVHFFPKSFAPGKNDVIIGRGKKCHGHFGNKQLKHIVLSNLDEYSMAVLQKEKSQILRSIVNQIRNNHYTRVGGFVKQDPKTKRWFDVGDNLAREKISKSFRDALNKCLSNHRHHQSNREMSNNTTETATNDSIGMCDNPSLERSTRLFQINSLSQKLERNQTSFFSPQCSVLVSDDSESASDDFFEEQIEPEPFLMQPSKKNNNLYFDSFFGIQDVDQGNSIGDLDDFNFCSDIFDEPNNIQSTAETGKSSCNVLEEINIQGLDRNGLDTPLHDNFFHSPSTPIQQKARTMVKRTKQLLHSSLPYATNQEGTKQFFKSVANFAVKKRKKSTRLNIITSRQA